MYNFMLFVALLATVVSGQQLVSPCPRTFQYQNDGQQWYGIIQVRSPPFGTKLVMNVKMTIGVRLPTRYVGQLELTGDRVGIIQQMLSNGVLRYKVHFPLFNPLPSPLLITFNGQTICQGPPARGAYITTINLDHSLSTETIGANGGTAPQTPSPATNEVVNNRPSHNNINDPLAGYEVEEYELVPTKDGNFVVVYKDRPNPDDFARPSVIDGAAVVGTTTTAVPTSPSTTAAALTQPAPQPTNPAPLPIWPDFEPTNAPSQPSWIAPQPTDATVVGYQCGVAYQTPNPLVVGGETVERGDWPWVVAIFVKTINGINFICGGTLVSTKHVLTAAHCVHEKQNRPVKVNEIVLKVGVFNIHDWTDEITVTRSVSNVELHPNFRADQVLATDIAIIVMAKTVTYNQYIIPACLWEGSMDLAEIVGRRATVVGWGRDENGLKATPEPRMAQLPIVSTDTCRASRVEFQVLTNDMTLCAGERDGTGPCNGDSGGGFFMRKDGHWVIRGIVSSSLKDPESNNQCNLHEYIIFTDVAKYNRWIKKIINS